MEIKAVSILYLERSIVEIQGFLVSSVCQWADCLAEMIRGEPGGQSSCCQYSGDWGPIIEPGET